MILASGLTKLRSGSRNSVGLEKVSNLDFQAFATVLRYTSLGLVT